MKYFLILFVFLFSSPVFAGTQEGFNQWLQGFKVKASQQGITQATLASTLSDTKFLPRVIELDKKQPESKITFARYRQNVVSQDRINQGRQELRKHAALLNEISKAYNVQPQYIVALWGIETNFGSNTGGFSVIDSLATLAYEGRRHDFFADELLKALKIIQDGHISEASMKGSWAGAMGQCQFMPSSFLNYAQDYNRDGRKDIWNTKADVFASAANYLARSGWMGDEKWGRHVKIPSHFTDSIIDRNNKKSLAEWSRLGVKSADGSPLPTVNIMAGLIAPDGLSGPAYLVYGNYDVIMKWNRSTYFATSVGLLADLIAMGQ